MRALSALHAVATSSRSLCTRTLQRSHKTMQSCQAAGAPLSAVQLQKRRSHSFRSDVPELKFELDTFDGVIIKGQSLPSEPEVFRHQLQHYLESWRQAGKKGVWLPIPKEKAQLIPFALQLGCEYHHAERDYVMLTNWLPDSRNTLPPGASHLVGVGAIVANEKREILVVQEKTGPLAGKNVWKMPTGLVECGENIKDAAVRELKEETGIDAEFLGLAAFRQAHQFRFNKSDLFFVVALRPLNFEITFQTEELDACAWIPLDEYLDQPWYRGRPLYEEMQKVIKAVVEGSYPLFAGRDLDTGNRGLMSFYYNRQSLRARHDNV